MQLYVKRFIHINMVRSWDQMSHLLNNIIERTVGIPTKSKEFSLVSIETMD